MHAEALQAMTRILTTAPIERDAKLSVLDVGSLDVNGTYRPLVESFGWSYTGLDVVAGPNVDVVSAKPYSFPLPGASFDVVISGSTMEHVEAIWLWVPELARMVRPGGLLAIVTHWQFPEHRFPVDCWRIMPDGMRFLFDQTGVLEDYLIEITSPYDIIGVAFKKKRGKR